LFGFKYWVIGKEVPDMLNEEQEEQTKEFDPTKPVERKKRFWTEKRYNTFNIIGLSINLLACTVLGCMRSKANYEKYKTGKVPV